MGLEKNIRIYERYLSEEKLEELYCKSDILLLASRYEAYGMVVPEAMAHGCSVIVSDTVGAKFMVRDGFNGYIFKTGSSKDLAEKIILASKNLTELQKKSITLMENEFSDKKIMEDYKRIISNAINKE